jgi:hypothetical protein
MNRKEGICACVFTEDVGEDVYLEKDVVFFCLVLLFS